MSKAENKLAEELARKIVHHVVNNQPDDINEPEWKALALQVAALLAPHLVGEWLQERIKALMMSRDGSTYNDTYNSALWDVLELLDAPPKGEQSHE